jgi:hypothetical protein
MAKLFSQGDGNELMGQSTVDLIKMIVQVTFAGHFLACVYLMVADDTEDPTMDTWLKDSGVSKFEDPWLKYMVSMYWSFTTMTTVGYGDVNPSPRNVPEHVFVMVAMIIGTSIFGYFVGNITVIFESFDVQASITKEKLERVRDYCQDKEIPKGSSAACRGTTSISTANVAASTRTPCLTGSIPRYETISCWSKRTT